LEDVKRKDGEAVVMVMMKSEEELGIESLFRLFVWLLALVVLLSSLLLLSVTCIQPNRSGGRWPMMGEEQGRTDGDIEASRSFYGSDGRSTTTSHLLWSFAV
jgi:hypothetical protein